MKCQGECHEAEQCTGYVKKVIVWGNGFAKEKAWQFKYCETARKEDERRGFVVELVDEIELTDIGK